MHIPTRAVLLTLALAGAAAAQDSPDREPILGGPCEGCEAVFQGLPDELAPAARIAPKDEPGEPMRIEGTVRNADGEPVAGVIVYAYHTDAGGLYPPSDELRELGRAALRHGRLRGWVRTDREGRYRFDTIRPASYPDTKIPAHVHMHVIEPDCCTYWIDSIEFRNDPLLDADAEAGEDARGGSGLVEPERDADGRWLVTRDIVLGANVPGHRDEDARKSEDAEPDGSTGSGADDGGD